MWLKRNVTQSAQLQFYWHANLNCLHCIFSALYKCTVKLKFLNLEKLFTGGGITRVGATVFFFLEKTDDIFSHHPLESDDLFQLSYLVSFLNSATKKNNFIRVSPLDGVTKGGPPPPPWWRHSSEDYSVFSKWLLFSPTHAAVELHSSLGDSTLWTPK